MSDAPRAEGDGVQTGAPDIVAVTDAADGADADRQPSLAEGGVAACDELVKKTADDSGRAVRP